MTSTTGAAAARRPSIPSNSSKNRPWDEPMLSAFALEASTVPTGPRSGTSRASSARPGPTTRSTVASGVTRIHDRSASTMGAYGTPPSPRSMQPPTRTSAPAARAASANSEMQACLPDARLARDQDSLHCGHRVSAAVPPPAARAHPSDRSRSGWRPACAGLYGPVAAPIRPRPRLGLVRGGSPMTHRRPSDRRRPSVAG